MKGCSYSPLALSVTGKSLSHKKLVVWRNRAKALSTEHSSTPDYYYKCVLTCLQKSLDVLDPKAIECFKDLSLFPEDQIIPVAALVDIWAELHCEDDADALENIYQLVNLSMADIIVTRYGVWFLNNLICCVSAYVILSWVHHYFHMRSFFAVFILPWHFVNLLVYILYLFVIM